MLVKGDVVQLNSGGPKMTVSFADDTNAIIIFFDAAGDFDKQTVPVKTSRNRSKLEYENYHNRTG